MILVNLLSLPQWLSIATTVLMLFLAVYSWGRRNVPGALQFAIGSMFTALWGVGAFLEYSVPDIAAKIFWVKFQGACQLPAVTAITSFLLEYAWPGRWLTRRNLAFLMAVPLLDWILILTNDYHHLEWHSFRYENVVIGELGEAFWIFLAYSLILVVINFTVLVWLFIRSPQHRWPVVIMITGQIVTRIFYSLDQINFLNAGLPLDIFGLSFLFLMYAIVLFEFRIFDPITMASQEIIQHLNAGMLVLDHWDRVVDLNPSAEQILQMTVKQVKHRQIRELLPAYPEVSLLANSEVEFELQNGVDQTVRYYTLAISPLRDWRGLSLGRLVMLRDITAKKQARQLEKEQLRSLAIVQERERLARELHESLGQSLAAAHLQASSAKLLLARGEVNQADDCLRLMADIAIAAEADVREYLLGSRTVFSPDLTFFQALHQYLERFSQHYNLPVELSIQSRLEVQGFGYKIEVQLLRIIQEALSNIRKHANAKTAQVIFSAEGPMGWVSISDDGLGFDPAAAEFSHGGSFGLRTMRERAESMGGVLDVISRPGSGTQVVVQVPLDPGMEMVAEEENNETLVGR